MTTSNGQPTSPVRGSVRAAVVSRPPRRDHVSTARTTSNCPAYIASAMAAFQVPITSSARKRPDRRYMSHERMTSSCLQGADAAASPGGSERRDDLPRSGPVNDTDALVARRQAGPQERDQDLVPFLLAGEQRADVIARLGVKSGDAQDNGIMCHGQFRPFRSPGAAARALRRPAAVRPARRPRRGTARSRWRPCHRRPASRQRVSPRQGW